MQTKQCNHFSSFYFAFDTARAHGSEISINPPKSRRCLCNHQHLLVRMQGNMAARHIFMINVAYAILLVCPFASPSKVTAIGRCRLQMCALTGSQKRIARVVNDQRKKIETL
jgi:hypothetical protein